MIITKSSLPRRTFLRGVGATLALPLLDAMVPALSAAQRTAATPRRLSFVYVPNGMNWMKWTPTGKGENFTLSPSLAPLEPFRRQMVVLSELTSVPAEAFGDGGGDHARATSSWLSGVHIKRTDGSDIRAGKTFDQYAADVLGKDSQFPSLQLAVDRVGGSGACEGGYACAYLDSLAWRTPTSPLPQQNDPRVVFERLVGGDARTQEERRLLAESERSILDSITAEARGLQRKVGTNDRLRLDEYLDGIRELELRIQKFETHAELEAITGEAPIGIPEDFEEHVKLMFDLQVLAFQADLTRVITFLVSRESTNRTYPQIGIPDPHHGLSHHGDDPIKLEKQAKIDQYHVTLLTYYLDKMRSTRDGEGSLLDSSLVMYGGCLSDGQLHSHRNLPTVLLGSLGGRIKGGRHVVCAKDTPLTNLQLRLMEHVDVKMDAFGDSTGPLVDL